MKTELTVVVSVLPQTAASVLEVKAAMSPIVLKEFTILLESKATKTSLATKKLQLDKILFPVFPLCLINVNINKLFSSFLRLGIQESFHV